MAVMDKTVERAKRLLDRRFDLFDRIGGIYPPPAMALFLVRETGDAVNSLTNQLGFWEVGCTMRTVGKRDGRGTAKDANIDPFGRISSYYGAQVEFGHAMARWIKFLGPRGFHTSLPMDVWLSLIHLPYSVGWREAEALIRSAGDVSNCPRDPISALRKCLELPDDELPDYGPQDDPTIRRRIKQALDLPKDVARVAPFSAEIDVYPLRIDGVEPFPRWPVLKRKIERLAAERGIADET